MLSPDPELAVDYGLFSVSQALAAGISRSEITRGVRLGRWERVERGVLQAGGRAPRPGDELLIAVLRAGPGAVAAFESAAQAYSWDLLQDPTKPQLIVPVRSHASRGDIYRVDLCAADVTLLGVLPLSTPSRTALDIAARAELECAVVAIDSAIRSQSVTLAELQACFRASRRNGVPQAREALALADPASGSVPETQARLLLSEKGLPAPVSQYSVYSDGLIVRTDFAWPWARVVLEVDGFAYHSASDPSRATGTSRTP
jgi:hypothetical protein